MSFRYRSSEKELLDNSSIDTLDLYRNLSELDHINRLLGGYQVSKKGMTSILKTHKSTRNILDIGFGGGDSIKQLSDHSAKTNSRLYFYGVDLKNDCVEYAKNNLSTLPNKKLICDDYRNLSSDLLKNIDVIHCSLFIHHLTNDEIVRLLQLGKSHQCIILINDLHRNWFAYYSIKLITTLLSKSKLVKNDAPLSVKRGFKKKELIALIREAGFREYTVTWTWAFRYLVIALK